MEVTTNTLIKGEIYYSCGENSCKPKRMYAQFGVETEANSQKETFHLLLSEVARKKHVKKKAEWRHHDLCGIVEGDLTLPMTGCWRRGQKQPKMAYIAICLQGKTLMLFNKSQQQTIHGSTLSDWRQTLFGALKCVANWYVVFAGSTVHVADLEVGSQVTLALTESGLSLLSNSLEQTNKPPHSVRRWSLSHVRCEQQNDNTLKVYAKEKDVTGEYIFQTKHCATVMKVVEAARANYLRSRKTPSASSSSETTSFQFTESSYDETEQSRISTESEHETMESTESEHSQTELETAVKVRLSRDDIKEDLTVCDDDKHADALLGVYDLTFSRRSRSTGCLASMTTVKPPDMCSVARWCRRSIDNLGTASCSCNINDLAADVKRLQNHRAIYSQMDTIVRTAAVHCSGLTSSGVIETVSPRATMRSTLKKRYAKPVGSLTLLLPTQTQSFDDNVIEGHHSRGQETQPRERSHSRSPSASRHVNGFSLYRSISEHDLIQPQRPDDWSAESICRCLNDVLNNHPPLPDTLRLPYKLRIQVCMRLYTQEDDDKGWKALAEKIGLNYDAMMIIQSFQHHHPCRVTAGEILLRHWQSAYNACGVDPLRCPVACERDKLVELLREIGRFDLVDLLR